ncbi:MAG: hypothetical protein RL173_877, partial [Fibrobacterota bacterium]
AGHHEESAAVEFESMPDLALDDDGKGFGRQDFAA